MKRFAVVLALVAMVGCSSNSLVMVIDGKTYVQELPSEVAFPLIIEELPGEVDKAEVKKAAEVKETAEVEAEVTQAPELEFPFVMTAKHSERQFRLQSGLAENQKYSPRRGVLANVSWW